MMHQLRESHIKGMIAAKSKANQAIRIAFLGGLYQIILRKTKTFVVIMETEGIFGTKIAEYSLVTMQQNSILFRRIYIFLTYMKLYFKKPLLSNFNSSIIRCNCVP